VPDAAVATLVFLGAGASFWIGLDRWRHQLAVRRLRADRAEAGGDLGLRRELVGRHPWAATLLGASAFLLLALVTTEQAPYRVAAAAVGAALGLLVEDRIAERRLVRLETQLADAIDLLVGALQAGAGLATALWQAAEASRPPFGPLLEDMSRRLRLGADPEDVFREPSARVPLASYRLFALSLATQWETGGSLAPALALVGRSVRDRLTLARRVASQTTAAVGSMVAVLGISYGVGLLMWLWEPGRVEAFLWTRVGALAVAACMILQALGLLWMAWLTKVRV